MAGQSNWHNKLYHTQENFIQQVGMKKWFSIGKQFIGVNPSETIPKKGN